MTPPRVTVTGPRSAATRARGRWQVSRGIGEQTEPGAVHVRSLMRAQLAQALRTCALVVSVVTGLPLLFAVTPELSQIRVAGFPLTWLVLAVCIQPIWIAAAFWQVRVAERTEREFTGVVGRS